MKRPTRLRDIQKFAGCLASLSRFISRLGEKALPLYIVPAAQEGGQVHLDSRGGRGIFRAQAGDVHRTRPGAAGSKRTNADVHHRHQPGRQRRPHGRAPRGRQGAAGPAARIT